MGGLLLGVGMVLASVCGSKSLVRMGGGSLKALVVLLVLGVWGFSTLKGQTAVLRVKTVGTVSPQRPQGQDQHGLLAGWPAGRLAGCAGAAGDRRPGIGAVVVGLWWVWGRLGLVAEHPVTLEPASWPPTRGAWKP